jgi:hypothetical protein
MSERVTRTVAMAVARFAVAFSCFATAAVGYRYVLGRHGAPALGWVIAVTALVALVLWLLRASLDRVVDRLVFGSRADAHQIMQDLLHRMASTLPVDEVVPRLAETASRTVRRPRAEVRLWLADGQRWSQAWPTSAEPEGSSVTVGVQHGGTPVGEIEVEYGGDEVSPFDRKLLDDLARPAGLALSTVRLTFELRNHQARLEQLDRALQASRDRLVTARREEQHRMQDEVAGRVLPHVDRATEALLVSTPADLEAAVVATTRALDTLRDIARGIYPPQLVDDGLLAAIDGWLLRTDRHLTIGVTGEVESLRSQPEIEACLYFCAVTALDALTARDVEDIAVQVTANEQAVTMELAARPSGADAATRLEVGAATLQAVRDRVEAFDGTMEVSQADGRTVLAGRIPLAGVRVPTTARWDARPPGCYWPKTASWFATACTGCCRPPRKSRWWARAATWPRQSQRWTRCFPTWYRPTSGCRRAGRTRASGWPPTAGPAIRGWGCCC